MDGVEAVGGGEDSNRPLDHCGPRFKRMPRGCLLLIARFPIVNTFKILFQATESLACIFYCC